MHSQPAPPSWGQRFTIFRGFLPSPRSATARDIRALWARRLEGAPAGHPIWLHVHVPYCPQICSFCHCGKLLLTSPAQLDDWLDRTSAELAFFAPAMAGARVRHMYLGGGTPNLLAPAQLDRLLTLLGSSFDFDPTGRRTLEMLPSAHRPGTLEVAARHGITRLSAGVQSTEAHLLDRVGRAPDFARLAEMMDEARRRGIEDVNVDLAWRLPGDTEELFFRSLASVLDLRPTTVSVHMLAPTPLSPVFRSPEEEAAVYGQFYRFAEGDPARRLAETHPDYVWRRLPTVMTLVRRDFLDAGHYRTWQYSDMETVTVDMFGLGRFALSHLLGAARYENLTRVGRFDPDEPGYRLTLTDGTVDGAMDAIAELVRDDVVDLAEVTARYGAPATRPVRAALDDLVARGHLWREEARYRRGPVGAALTLGPIGELLDVASSHAAPLNPGGAAPAPARKRVPLKQAVEEPHLVVEVDGRGLKVFVEEARPAGNYYRVVGRFGFYYRDAAGLSGSALREALERVARGLEGAASASAAEACVELKRSLGAVTGIL